VDKARILPALRGASRTLAIAGIALLGYCGYVTLEANLFQKQQSAALDQSISASVAPPIASRDEDPPAVHRGVSVSLSQDRGAIGRLEIPRLELSAMVLEGSTAQILRRAPGHIPGTAMPGDPGNAVITGHRDTFFRPLRNIRESDLIRFRTARGVYTYRVTSISVVEPDYTAVLEGNREQLTLITCFPFSFVGPAPRRFIVRAARAAETE